MPQALAVDLRRTIVERHRAGASLPAIAREMELSPWTVRTLWRRYRDRGEAGLLPDYAACGRPGPRHAPALAETVLALRRAHPGWGAGLIRIELAARFPDHPLPPDLALWLLGWGIALVWNRPRHKQGNAVVERAHGVCQRWVEAHTCQSAAELQARLDYFTTLQRERYPYHGAASRLAVFPALVHSGRPFAPAPATPPWDERRVWQVLAQRVLRRRVDQVGRISLANRALGVGRAWAGNDVTVRLAVVDETPIWHIHDTRGTLVRQHPAPELSRERILALAVSRRPTSRPPVKPSAHQEGKPYTR